MNSEETNTPPEQSQTVIINNASKKSVGLALLLALFFGPLGLLYASVTGALIMFLICIPVAFFTVGIGLIFTNIICVIWAIVAVNSHNSKAGQVTVIR